MRALVLGAGVVGVTTAYYLAKAGLEVEVIDRQTSAAVETSYANAGQLSYGYSAPWAAPDIPFKAIKWLFQRHAPLAISLTSDINQYKWMWQLLLNCTPRRYDINKERMVRLAEYSRECIGQLRDEIGIQYEGRELGLTQLLRTPRQLKNVANDMAILDRFNVPYRLLKPSEIGEVEPALSSREHKLTGALHLPEDESGDCYLFTQRLMEKAKELGVTFTFNTSINRFERKDSCLLGVWAGCELKQADFYIMAAGCYSPELLLPLDIKLPVYPLKGYSLTLPIAHPESAVRATILDETYKVAITRFDNRIRVGGMAEIMGFDLGLNPDREETLSMVLEDLFPNAADTSNTNFWSGLRPATPDGTPVIGHTPYRNLFMNTGHGTLGWTMACGSGKLLTDIIAGNATEISTAGYSVARYS
ncbi:MAG: D-amino acid dehydrogenase [Venatoribacter sp.]